MNGSADRTLRLGTPTSSLSAERMQRMGTTLEARFKPLSGELIDESAAHAGHAGAASGAGHYRVRIVSESFTGLSRVKRHRLVYDCLLGMMHTDIHALAIEAAAPDECVSQ